MPARPVRPSEYALCQKRLIPRRARADVLLVLSRIVAALVCAIVLLAIPQSASAGALLPPDGKVFTGVAMGSDIEDFTRRSGQAPHVWQQFVAWNGAFRWAVDLAR